MNFNNIFNRPPGKSKKLEQEKPQPQAQEKTEGGFGYVGYNREKLSKGYFNKKEQFLHAFTKNSANPLDQFRRLNTLREEIQNNTSDQADFNALMDELGRREEYKLVNMAYEQFDFENLGNKALEKKPRNPDNVNNKELQRLAEDYAKRIAEEIAVSKGAEAGKRYLAAALAFIITATSINDASASINTPTAFSGGAPTTINVEQKAQEAVAEYTYNFNKLREAEGGEKEEKKDGTEGGGKPIVEGNPISLTSAYFETGTVIYKPGAREKAKHDILVYLTGVDLESGLANSKIIVKGLSSKERPPRPGPNIPPDFNDVLARQRTEEGLKLVQEVLKEYFNGQHVEIETVVASNASVYDGKSEAEIREIDAIAASSPEEFAKLIDAKQSITVEAITTNPKPPTFDKSEDYKHVEVVFGDRSRSMKVYMGQVELVATRVNELTQQTEQIKIIDLEGGDTEQHLQTMIHYLKSEEGQKGTGNLFLITDEGVNQGKNEKGEDYVKRYNTEVEELLRLAGNRQVVVKFLNPEPTPGKNDNRYIIFNLTEHKYGLRRPPAPQGGGSTISGFTETDLNKKAFNEIDRYMKGKKAEKEKVSGDRTFHPTAKGTGN